MAYNEQQYHSGPSNNPAAAATETGPHTEHREPNLNKRNMPAGQVPASRGGPDAAARFTAAGLDAVYDGRLPGVPRPRSTNGGYPSSTDPGTDDSPMPQPHPAAYPQTGGGNGGNGGNNGGVVAYPPQLTATFLALHNSGYGHLYPASVGRWVDNAGAARLNPLPPPAGGSVGYTSAGGSVAAYMGTTHGAGGDEDLRSQWAPGHPPSYTALDTVGVGAWFPTQPVDPVVQAGMDRTRMEWEQEDQRRRYECQYQY